MLGAFAVLWPATAESPVGAVGRVMADTVRTDDTVRIEHEVIHIAPPPRTSARRVLPERNRSLPVRFASDQRPAQRSKAPTIAERATRAFLGDGRYRPQPFPRPGR